MLQQARMRVHVSPEVRHYIVALVQSTRAAVEVALGASPRASLALQRVAQAAAILEGREFVTPDEQAILDRPISELNLSVRARKCMIRLGLNTVGELLRKTGDDLLECKNFGVTSLNEVREKLVLKGLKLRGD